MLISVLQWGQWGEGERISLLNTHRGGVELELMRVQNKSVVFWPWVLAALQSKEVVWGQFCFGFRHLAGLLMTLSFVLFKCTVGKNAAQEKEKKKALRWPMSNYTNTLKLCGLHFSHSTAFHVQINSCWQAFGIHYDLLTLNNNIRDTESLIVSVLWRCFVKGVGRSANDVNPSCLYKDSFKSDIYSTVTKSTVLALHWKQWILRQFVKSYTNNCISVRHYSSSSPKYGLTIHTLLSHKCMKAIPMP